MRFRCTSPHCLRRCCRCRRIRRRASQRTVRHRGRPSPLRVGLLNMLPCALCVGECGPIRRCHCTQWPTKHITAVHVCRCVSHLGEGGSAILHTYWIESASSCFASGSEYHQECCRIETIHAKARGQRFHFATRPEHSPLACSSRRQRQLVSITKMWMIRCTQSCHFLTVLKCRPWCVCVHTPRGDSPLCARS